MRPPAEARPDLREDEYTVSRPSDIAPLATGGTAASTAAGAVEPVVVSGPLARLELNPKRNPYILALWIIGAGFVVLGIALYCISVTASYSGPTPSSDVGSLVFAQLGWMLAGPLITAGLLTLVGLLFLTAIAGRRAPREPVPLDDEL